MYFTQYIHYTLDTINFLSGTWLSVKASRNCLPDDRYYIAYYMLYCSDFFYFFVFLKFERIIVAINLATLLVCFFIQQAFNANTVYRYVTGWMAGAMPLSGYH